MSYNSYINEYYSCIWKGGYWNFPKISIEMDLWKSILFHTKWGVLELGLYFKSIDQSKYIEYVTSFGNRKRNIMVDPGHKSNLFRLVAKLLTKIDIKDVVVQCLEIEFGDMVISMQLVSSIWSHRSILFKGIYLLNLEEERRDRLC